MTKEEVIAAYRSAEQQAAPPYRATGKWIGGYPGMRRCVDMAGGIYERKLIQYGGLAHRR
ncbi:hypothetical protein [Neorhizobium sp. LjRoot104]|uniref:hypothetical protein n=1 Tax=Neorhizobium sp. LjRoot104 TaxID=3342254 RepID=UPI003ECEC2F0